MPSHNHSRPDDAATAVVVDLFAEKRHRLRQQLDSVHPALRPEEAQTTLATVTPIRGGRRRDARGD